MGNDNGSRTWVRSSPYYLEYGQGDGGTEGGNGDARHGCGMVVSEGVYMMNGTPYGRALGCVVVNTEEYKDYSAYIFSALSPLAKRRTYHQILHQARPLYTCIVSHDSRLRRDQTLLI